MLLVRFVNPGHVIARHVSCNGNLDLLAYYTR